MTHNDLQGKVAIVTGGARGIGESIVKVLASRGASIVINYTSSGQSANALVEHIKSTGGEALAVQANIGELDGAKKIVDAAVKAYGKIDIIVNNAGIAEFHPVTQVDTDSFERQYNVNVRGPLLLVKESAPHLQEYGRIINLSSVGARNGFPGGSVYAGTKGALDPCRACGHQSSLASGSQATASTLDLSPRKWPRVKRATSSSLYRSW